MGEFGLPEIPDAELERIAVPTSLIWGRQDLATPLAVAEAVSARHGWPLHVIEDCGDDPPIEQPEAFLRALRSELADAERAGGRRLRRRDRGPRRRPATTSCAASSTGWSTAGRP